MKLMLCDMVDDKNYNGYLTEPLLARALSERGALKSLANEYAFKFTKNKKRNDEYEERLVRVKLSEAYIQRHMFGVMSVRNLIYQKKKQHEKQLIGIHDNSENNTNTMKNSYETKIIEASRWCKQKVRNTESNHSSIIKHFETQVEAKEKSINNESRNTVDHQDNLMLNVAKMGKFFDATQEKLRTTEKSTKELKETLSKEDNSLKDITACSLGETNKFLTDVTLDYKESEIILNEVTENTSLLNQNKKQQKLKKQVNVVNKHIAEEKGQNNVALDTDAEIKKKVQRLQNIYNRKKLAVGATGDSLTHQVENEDEIWLKTNNHFLKNMSRLSMNVKQLYDEKKRLPSLSHRTILEANQTVLGKTYDKSEQCVIKKVAVGTQVNSTAEFFKIPSKNCISKLGKANESIVSVLSTSDNPLCDRINAQSVNEKTSCIKYYGDTNIVVDADAVSNKSDCITIANKSQNATSRRVGLILINRSIQQNHQLIEKAYGKMNPEFLQRVYEVEKKNTIKDEPLRNGIETPQQIIFEFDQPTSLEAAILPKKIISVRKYSALKFIKKKQFNCYSSSKPLDSHVYKLGKRTKLSSCILYNKLHLTSQKCSGRSVVNQEIIDKKEHGYTRSLSSKDSNAPMLNAIQFFDYSVKSDDYAEDERRLRKSYSQCFDDVITSPEHYGTYFQNDNATAKDLAKKKQHDATHALGQQRLTIHNESNTLVKSAPGSTISEKPPELYCNNFSSHDLTEEKCTKLVATRRKLMLLKHRMVYVAISCAVLSLRMCVSKDDENFFYQNY